MPGIEPRIYIGVDAFGAQPEGAISALAGDRAERQAAALLLG
jgi:hypothetical protein